MMRLRTGCSCCGGSPHQRVFLADATAPEVAVKRDPTGTQAIRVKFRHEVEGRFRALKRLITQAVAERDVLGLGAVSVGSILSASLMRPLTPHMQPLGAAPAANKVLAFQNWVDEALRQTLLGENGGHWVLPYLRMAYMVGYQRAQAIVRTPVRPDLDQVDVMHRLAVVELQGTMEVISQRAVRMVGDGLTRKLRPFVISRGVNQMVDKEYEKRGRLLANTFPVRAHAEATLDTFEAAGLTRVGILPEWKPTIKIPPLKITDARRKPSGDYLVNILTAGDDDVCDECQDIAADAPYEIGEARGLIPAHPNCRCAFVPFFDARFAEADALPVRDEWREEDHPRDDIGRFGEGGGAAAISGGGSDTRITSAEVDELWEDYDQAALIKEVSAGGTVRVGDTTNAGETVTEEMLAKVKAAAKLLQEQAESTVSKHKEVWRGLALPAGTDVSKTFKGNSVVEMRGLTATSSVKALAQKYADPQYIGEDDGQRVLLRIERKGNVIGVDRNTGLLGAAETVLPHGAKYRVSGTYQDGQFTVVRLYDNGKLNTVKKKTKDAFDPDQPRDDHGRWTSGGGGGISAEGQRTSTEIHEISKHMKGTSPERKGFRAEAAAATTPEERLAAHEKVVASFVKQRDRLAKNGKDIAEVSFKIKNYVQKYGIEMPPPPSVVVAPPPPPVIKVPPSALPPEPPPAIKPPPSSATPPAGPKVGKPGGTGRPKVYGGDDPDVYSKRSVAGREALAGVNAIPAEHAAVIKNVQVSIVPEIKIEGRQGSFSGVFRSRGTRAVGIEVGMQTTVGGRTYPVMDIAGTTVHELAHALDHAYDWKLNKRIASTAFEEVQKMSDRERVNASYWVDGGPVELFAELYNLEYNPRKSSSSARPFGMSNQRARDVFEKSLRIIREL